MPPVPSGLGNMMPPSPGKKVMLGMGVAMLLVLMCFAIAMLALPSEGAPGNKTPTATTTSDPNAATATIAATVSISATAVITPSVTPIVPATSSAGPTGTATVAPQTLPCTFVTGLIYNDLNANRVLDSGEPGINGASIQLQTTSGNVLSFAVTDTKGAYQLLNLPFGSYRILVAASPGFNPTTPTVLPINLSGCGGFTDLNFGFNQPSQASNPTAANPPTQAPVATATTAAPPPITPTPIILIVTSTPLPPTPTPIIVTAVPPPPTPTFTPTPTLTPTPTPTATPAFFITGATAKTTWTDCPSVAFDGTITAIGQGTAVYQWEQENGSTSAAQTLTFFTSGTLTVPQYIRNIEGGGALGTNGWVRLKILSPNSLDSNQAIFQFSCDSTTIP